MTRRMRRRNDDEEDGKITRGTCDFTNTKRQACKAHARGCVLEASQSFLSTAHLLQFSVRAQSLRVCPLGDTTLLSSALLLPLFPPTFPTVSVSAPAGTRPFRPPVTFLPPPSFMPCSSPRFPLQSQLFPCLPQRGHVPLGLLSPSFLRPPSRRPPLQYPTCGPSCLRVCPSGDTSFRIPVIFLLLLPLIFLLPPLSRSQRSIGFPTPFPLLRSPLPPYPVPLPPSSLLAHSLPPPRPPLAAAMPS